MKGAVMFNNVFKITLRNLRRYKGYSFINIAGLATGIASCILILFWVYHELSYDRFHKNSERIYRLYHELTLGGNTRVTPVAAGPMAAEVTQSVPEAEQSVRIFPFDNLSVKLGDKEFREKNVYFTDKNFFDVFSFPLTSGNPSDVLAMPFRVVLSQTTAQKYFGDENPVGKTLKFSDGHEYTVTGVIRDVPDNSHLQFDMLCSFETLYARKRTDLEDWGTMRFSTYVLLKPDANAAAAEEKINAIVDQKLGNELRQLGGSLVFHIQPLTRIHLFSDFEVDRARTGDIVYIYLFSGIAFFILLIACINFINLATARYANRAMEVGLRKTLGANRGNLIAQFMGETFVVTFLSVGIGCILSLLALPVMNSVIEQQISNELFLQPWFYASLVSLTFLVGMISGSYPSVFLSSFEPVKTLKGALKTGAAGSFFRRVLVVGQFAISITLIVATLTIFRQIRFVKNTNLGFSKEQILVLPLSGFDKLSPEALKKEFISVPGVLSAGFSSEVPGQGLRMSNAEPEGKSEKESMLMQMLSFDDTYTTVMGLEILQGRGFIKSMGTDKERSVIINETAAKRIGWDDPVGKTVKMSSWGEEPMKIIGVVRDYHTMSLHQKIEPLVITNHRDYRFFSMKISAGDISGTIAGIKTKWAEAYPGRAFDYFFLDDSFDKLYRSEEKIYSIFSAFAVIALSISCLGLFGLAAYMTEKRTKEVGIRKVLGAHVGGIIMLLSKEFTQWVIVANIIAWPAAYYLMDRWLQRFAYRIEPDVWTFIFAGIIALLIAWITVSYQSIKAARANPVESLRYE